MTAAELEANLQETTPDLIEIIKDMDLIIINKSKTTYMILSCKDYNQMKLVVR